MYISSQQDELLASQHYDDNSVACIEEKCFVVGIRQYCRYEHTQPWIPLHEYKQCIIPFYHRNVVFCFLVGYLISRKD